MQRFNLPQLLILKALYGKPLVDIAQMPEVAEHTPALTQADIDIAARVLELRGLLFRYHDDGSVFTATDRLLEFYRRRDRSRWRRTVKRLMRRFSERPSFRGGAVAAAVVVISACSTTASWNSAPGDQTKGIPLYHGEVTPPPRVAQFSGPGGSVYRFCTTDCPEPTPKKMAPPLARATPTLPLPPRPIDPVSALPAPATEAQPAANRPAAAALEQVDPALISSRTKPGVQEQMQKALRDTFQNLQRDVQQRPEPAKVPQPDQQAPIAPNNAVGDAPKPSPAPAAVKGGTDPVSSINSDSHKTEMLARAMNVEFDNDPLSALDLLKQSWTEKDAELMLTQYAGEFRPDSGMKRSQWESARRAVLARNGKITVDYDVRLLSHTSMTRAKVLVWQTYNSPYFRSRVGKVFTLSLEGDSWKIDRESLREWAGAGAAPPSVQPAPAKTASRVADIVDPHDS